MRIAVQSARIMDRLGAQEGFGLLSRLGFEGVDFGIARWLPANDVRAGTPSPLEAPLAEVLPLFEPYKHAAQACRIFFSQTHAPFPTWLPGRPELGKRMLAVIKTSIAITGYLGSPYCVVHPAYAPLHSQRPSAREEWALNRELYVALIPHLREHRVICCLENMFSSGMEGIKFASACSDFSLAASWIDELNALAGEECFGFCLDTGHCHLARQSLPHAIATLGKRLKALHIHDNAGHLDQHLAPFMGGIDWDGFLAALKSTGYQGDLAFETFKVLDQYPAEMMDACLGMIAQTGRYFKSRLSYGMEG